MTGVIENFSLVGSPYPDPVSANNVFTGFTFVVVVTCVFAGLYVFNAQISAASPKMGPALAEYVATVDRYRVDLKQTADEWKEWVTNRVQGIKEKAEKQGLVETGGEAPQPEQPAAQKP